MSNAGIMELCAPSGDGLNVQYDSLASLLKAVAPVLGTGSAGETDTAAARAQVVAAAVLGDGTPANPGLGLPALQSRLQGSAGQLVAGLRWDTLLQRLCRAFFTEVEAAIRAGQPPAWNLTSGGVTHPLDGHLLRLNGFSSPVAGSLAAGSLAAANTTGGGMAPVTAGSAPYVVHTLVGQFDWQESLPSAEAARVPIGAIQNGYTYRIAGAVPAGVSRVRAYRSLCGADSGGPYAWVSDPPVSAGSAYPAITPTASDSTIRQDWQPPSWAACLQVPETALLFGLAFALNDNGALVYGPNGQLNPLNVALTPTTSQLGIGNTAASGLFGVLDIGAGYTANSFQTANLPPSIQGFAGGAGIQARIVTALNGACAPTISYAYYDAAHGWGNAQTQSGVTTAGFSSEAVGGLAAYTVPPGRIVQSVQVTNPGGSATSGAVVFEATQVRPY